jgi:hypothetical protein
MRTRPSSIPLRPLIAVVVIALLLGAASAVTARAASVGPQQSAHAPETFPAAIAGGFAAGAAIPAGDVLLSRRVTMQPGESWRTVTFTCPAGIRALAPGLTDPSELTMAVAADQYRRPRRRFRLRVRPAPARFVSEPTASGTVFLVCGTRLPR